MVIIFAVMFVGGVESLSSGNEASPVSITPSAVADSGSASPSAGSASPTALTSPASGTTPSTTTTPTSATPQSWVLDVQPGSCVAGTKDMLKRAQIAISGTSKGYMAVSRMKGGTYQVVGTAEFSPPRESYTIPLINDLDFNINAWRITVFSGGSKNGDVWEGGFMQKTYDGAPTGC